MANNDHTLTQSCSHCREVKSLDDFHKAKGKPNGRHPQCKDCRSDLGKDERRAKDTRFAERIRLVESGQQRCVGCGEIKPLGKFYKSSRSTSGRKGQCVECYRLTQAEYCARDEVVEMRKRQFQERRTVDPEKYMRMSREYRFRSIYGISLDDYDEMLVGQGGRCAICFALPMPDTPLYVDHCHSTGAVRGLLCRACNSGIGQLEDDVNRMKSAIRYLEDHNASTPAPKLPMPRS